MSAQAALQSHRRICREAAELSPRHRDRRSSALLSGLVVQQAAIVIGLLIEALGFNFVADHFRPACEGERALISCLKVGRSRCLNPATSILRASLAMIQIHGSSLPQPRISATISRNSARERPPETGLQIGAGRGDRGAGAALLVRYSFLFLSMALFI